MTISCHVCWTKVTCLKKTFDGARGHLPSVMSENSVTFVYISNFFRDKSNLNCQHKLLLLDKSNLFVKGTFDGVQICQVYVTSETSVVVSSTDYRWRDV